MFPFHREGYSVARYRWEITWLNGTVQRLETEEPEPPTDLFAFTVTDELGRRHSYCWYNIARITAEQLQEPAGANAPA